VPRQDERPRDLPHSAVLKGSVQASVVGLPVGVLRRVSTW